MRSTIAFYLGVVCHFKDMILKFVDRFG
uniref:Uncharacterized protein n=1 Tax=Arundo donax TaxID=35708 RepID=A0A0A8ZV44_ARUDO